MFLFVFRNEEETSLRRDQHVAPFAQGPVAQGLRLEDQGAGERMDAADLLGQELEEPVLVPVIEFIVCLCRAVLRNMDQQFR